MFKIKSFIAVLCIVLFCAGVLPAQKGWSAPADELKAAYLLNFARLTTWPVDAFISANDPLVFCGAPSDPVMEALRGLGERNVDSRPIKIKTLRSPKENNGCHVLFLSSASSHSLSVVSSTQRRGLLLVGESGAFLEQGGIINYFLQAGKLRFEINVENARTADLVLSARLLNLARRPGEAL